MWISGEPFVFTDWSADSQPDNNGAGGEMCVHIRAYSYHTINGFPLEDTKWNDLDCTATSGIPGTLLRPICKQDQTV